MKLISFLLANAIALSFGAVSASADDVKPSGPPSVTLYSLPNYAGRRVVLNRDTPKLKKLGFAGQTMSMKVQGGRWEVCSSNRYNGSCEVFGPGDYNFGIFNWGNKIKSVHHLRRATPTITLYTRENMKGQSHTYAGNMPRIKDYAVNDFAQSIKVNGGEWVVCKNSVGKGKCETIHHDVADLRTIGLAGAISSLYRAAEWHDDSLDGGSGYSGGGGGYSGSGLGGSGGPIGNTGRFAPEITLYEGYNFTGARITIDRLNSDLRNIGFSNRASSIRLGAGSWELCDGYNFSKLCHTIESHESNLGTIDLDKLITSIRPVSSGYGGDSRRNGADTRGFEGQRTVFFAEPTVYGAPVASSLYRNRSNDPRAAANAFCRQARLGKAVYYDEARSYSPPYLLGERHIARDPGQPRLIDVLCSR